MSSNFESSVGEELNRYKVSRECTRCPGDGDNRGVRTKPLKKRGTTAHTATIILTPGTESRSTLRLLDFQYRFRSDIDLLILHRSFLKHAVYHIPRWKQFQNLNIPPWNRALKDGRECCCLVESQIFTTLLNRPRTTNAFLVSTKSIRHLLRRKKHFTTCKIKINFVFW